MPLRTFGGLSLAGTRFARRKPLLLAVYLALQGPQDRRYLAELFWPQAAKPLQNLAVAASQLRAVDPALLRSDAGRVWTEIACDATWLVEAAMGRDWRRVTELYQGPFLAGVDVDDGNVELEEWLFEKRESFALYAATAFVELAEQQLAAGDLQGATRSTDRAATLAPDASVEPLLVERLHALLTATGNPRQAALRREARELGIELRPDAEPKRHVTVHNLPSELTAWVGRRDEMTALSQLLLRGERLITITGLGGMGKTRLALELARRLKASTRFEQIFFVPLEALRDPAQLDSSLLEAVRSRSRQRRASDTLLNALGSKRTLLLLDNFDHLTAAATRLAELLSEAPQLSLLVTSRSPLGVAGEVQYLLEGLPLYAVDEADTSRGEDSTPLTATLGDALVLYRQVAQRYLPDFEVTEQNRGAVLAICQLVAGAPLGIELAAALNRVISADELLDELEHGLDVLRADLRHASERHASLRSVFESTWLRLTDEKRAALAGSSVFIGGFTRSSAAAVLGLEVDLIASLLDESLLRRHGSRFELHPLVQQYATEKLASYPEGQRWRAKHAEYYCAFFAGKRQFDQRSGQRQAFEELALEFPNVGAAWRWAANAGRPDLLETAVFMVSRFLLDRGEARELTDLLDAAATVAPPGSLLDARVRRARASLLAWDDPERARQYLEEALAITLEQDRHGNAAPLYHELGTVHAFLGDAERARRYWLDALPLLEQQDDEQLLAGTLINIAYVTADAKEHELWGNRATAVAERTGATAQLTMALAGRAGQLTYSYGDYHGAVKLLDEAIDIETREIGRADHLARLHSIEAYILLHAGDVARAEQQLMTAFQLVGVRPGEVDANYGRYPSLNWALGHLHYARGDLGAARAAAELAPNDLLGRELLCHLALEQGELSVAEEHFSALSILRGYGFTTRARLHERLVAHLLRAELILRAPQRSGEHRARERRFASAVSELLATLEGAVEFVFVPLCLEALFVAYTLEPNLAGERVLQLAAHHPAGYYYARRRALSLEQRSRTLVEAQMPAPARPHPQRFEAQEPAHERRGDRPLSALPPQEVLAEATRVAERFKEQANMAGNGLREA